MIDDQDNAQDEETNARRYAAFLAASSTFLAVGGFTGGGGGGGGSGDSDDTPYTVVREMSPVPPTVQDGMNVNRSVQNGYTALQGSFEIVGGRFNLTSADVTNQAIVVASLMIVRDCTVETKLRTGTTSYPVARLRAAPPLIGGWIGYTCNLVNGFARVRKWEGTLMPNVKANIAAPGVLATDNAKIRVTGDIQPLVEVFANGVLAASWTDTSGSPSAEGYAGVIGGSVTPGAHYFQELEIIPS